MVNNAWRLVKELREKRKKLRISQSWLSKRIGMSSIYISKIENGQKMPTLNDFVMMANELGYEVILQKIEKQNVEGNKTFVDDSLKVQEKQINIQKSL